MLSATVRVSLAEVGNQHPPLEINCKAIDISYSNFGANADCNNFNFRKANFPEIHKAILQVDYVFVEPFHKLLNLIIKTSTFLANWKNSLVTPIFKKGDTINLYVF